MNEDVATVRFTAIAGLQQDEIVGLQDMAGPIVRHDAGSVLQPEHEAVGELCLLLDGWAVSSVAGHGGSRQIVKVHLPGDLLGVASLPFSETVDTIVSLTEVQVSSIKSEALGRLFEGNSRLAAMLFLISLEERVMLVDRMAKMGRAEASARVAALILQLRERLRRNDPGLGLTFKLPLTQSHIADMIGATTNHVSRVFQELSAAGLLKWTRGKLVILNLEELQRLAQLPLRKLARNPLWLPRR